MSCRGSGGKPRHCRCAVFSARCGVRSVRERQWGVCFQMRAALWVAADQRQLVELVQPTGHRPPSPPAVKERGVAHDVGDVLDRWIGHRMVLVKGVRPADPAQRYTRCGGKLAEVGVLRAIAAVSGPESADAAPCRCGHGERQ